MSWSQSRGICGLFNVATRYALTMPTPVVDMESLADATKGKAKAADGEAEEKKKENEGTRKNIQKKRSPPAATPTPNQPRRPSEAAP